MKWYTGRLYALCCNELSDYSEAKCATCVQERQGGAVRVELAAGAAAIDDTLTSPISIPAILVLKLTSFPYPYCRQMMRSWLPATSSSSRLYSPPTILSTRNGAHSFTSRTTGRLLEAGDFYQVPIRFLCFAGMSNGLSDFWGLFMMPKQTSLLAFTCFTRMSSGLTDFGGLFRDHLTRGLFH